MNQISISAKAPSVADAKKILKQHEKEQEKKRIEKAKGYRARLENLQGQINALNKSKSDELADLEAQRKKIVLQAKKVVEKFDTKIQRLQEKQVALRKEADAKLAKSSK